MISIDEFMGKYRNISSKIRVLNPRENSSCHPSHNMIKENLNMYFPGYTKDNVNSFLDIDPFVIIMERDKGIDSSVHTSQSVPSKPPKKKMKRRPEEGRNGSQKSYANDINEDMEKFMITYQISNDDKSLNPRPVHNITQHEPLINHPHMLSEYVGGYQDSYHESRYPYRKQYVPHQTKYQNDFEVPNMMDNHQHGHMMQAPPYSSLQYHAMPPLVSTDIAQQKMYNHVQGPFYPPEKHVSSNYTHEHHPPSHQSYSDNWVGPSQPVHTMRQKEMFRMNPQNYSTNVPPFIPHAQTMYTPYDPNSYYPDPALISQPSEFSSPLTSYNEQHADKIYNSKSELDIESISEYSIGSKMLIQDPNTQYQINDSLQSSSVPTIPETLEPIDCDDSIAPIVIKEDSINTEEIPECIDMVIEDEVEQLDNFEESKIVSLPTPEQPIIEIPSNIKKTEPIPIVAEPSLSNVNSNSSLPEEEENSPLPTEIIYPSSESQSESDDTEQDLLNRLRSYNDRYINGKIEDILNQKILSKDKFFLLTALEKQILKSPGNKKRSNFGWK